MRAEEEESVRKKIEIAKRRRVGSTLSKCPSYISYRKKTTWTKRKEKDKES